MCSIQYTLLRSLLLAIFIEVCIFTKFLSSYSFNNWKNHFTVSHYDCEVLSFVPLLFPSYLFWDYVQYIRSENCYIAFSIIWESFWLKARLTDTNIALLAFYSWMSPCIIQSTFCFQYFCTSNVLKRSFVSSSARN